MPLSLHWWSQHSLHENIWFLRERYLTQKARTAWISLKEYLEWLSQSERITIENEATEYAHGELMNLIDWENGNHMVWALSWDKLSEIIVVAQELHERYSKVLQNRSRTELFRDAIKKLLTSDKKLIFAFFSDEFMLQALVEYGKLRIPYSDISEIWLKSTDVEELSKKYNEVVTLIPDSNPPQIRISLEDFENNRELLYKNIIYAVLWSQVSYLKHLYDNDTEQDALDVIWYIVYLENTKG